MRRLLAGKVLLLRNSARQPLVPCEEARHNHHLFERLRADIVHYRRAGCRWYAHAGFWVGANHRFGSWALTRAPAPLRKPLALTHALISLPVRLLTGVDLSPRAEIGGGLLLWHPQSILVPAGAKLGDGCALYHEVTLGVRGDDHGKPQLEDGVVVFAGARILGAVKVGAHAEIGANCVVTRDIPAGAAVGVAPARIVPKRMLDSLRHTGSGSEQS